ncbi:MAG TPA: condensation domain-containing protein, partial [Pyrinomonadaceae bacterium]|nr:condensation domain-containing protein [Pyrinomonadaceae bacterium]
MRAENLVDIYELSPLQQGLLFHSLYAPESGVYIEQLTITLSGDIDLPAFKWAWEQAMGRHAVLRTAFYWEGIEKPHQVVYREVELPWEQHDWRSLSETQQAEQMKKYLSADRARGFDFSQPPMMRFALMQIADKVYRLVWCFHHVILDGWSTGVILKDVAAFYKARTQGTEPELVEERPYSDYISWIKAQDLSAAENFWRTTLKGFARPTRLNLGHGGVASVESATEVAHHLDETAEAEYYARQLYTLSSETSTAIFAFARQHQLTVNTLVQAAWAVLLSRYSGEQDVVFGVTSSGRPPEIKGVEQMVGLFVNTLPMRLKLDATLPVADWLQQVQRQQFQSRQYEYSPLVEVQGWSEVPRGEQLFESLLGYQNYPIRLDSSLFSLDGRLEASDIGALEMVSFPLCFLVIPGEELMVRVYHDLRRFDVATVKRMAGHFEMLLKGIVAHPDRSVNELSILTAVEEQEIVVDWNRTTTDYPRNKSLAELFEAQVERAPDSIALTSGEVQLTYSELNCRANQLAHHLQSLGVKREALV